MSKNDNRTKICFDYEGKAYELVYSADALRKMEKNYGIKFAKLDEQVLTATEDLFVGAFIANHSNVPMAKRMEIFHALCGTVEGGNDGIFEVLSEMLNEAIEDMKPKGNVSWKVMRKA